MHSHLEVDLHPWVLTLRGTWSVHTVCSDADGEASSSSAPSPWSLASEASPCLPCAVAGLWLEALTSGFTPLCPGLCPLPRPPTPGHSGTVKSAHVCLSHSLGNSQQHLGYPKSPAQGLLDQAPGSMCVQPRGSEHSVRDSPGLFYRKPFSRSEGTTWGASGEPGHLHDSLCGPGGQGSGVSVVRVQP